MALVALSPDDALAAIGAVLEHVTELKTAARDGRERSGFGLRDIVRHTEDLARRRLV